MTEVRVLDGVIDAPQLVSDHVRIDGLVRGDIRVANGGRLDLTGTCWGNLSVDSGGVAEVGGIVKGNVVNVGGRLEVSGVVWGELKTTSGETVVQPGAIIRKRKDDSAA